MRTVRLEQPEDVEAVRRLNEKAFGTPAEAGLVDLLRVRGKIVVSLVAVDGGRIMGYIAFSRVSVAANPMLRGVGLGPMAVIPDAQRQGVGTRLVRAGLDHCRDMGYEYAVVVGHPDYYPRFGFVPAQQYGITCLWEVPKGVFMALELRSRGLAGSSGLATYEPEFSDA
jgi:putative acetyltransferase